jgi:antitoxin MazE
MQVSKWGNSLAVRLPKKLVKELQLAPGDELAVVEASKDRIAVEKRDRRKEALDRMKKRRWSLPTDYRFDREEANKR